MLDVDFTSLPSNILFMSGESSGAQSCINITIISDGIVEEKEYLSINLTSAIPGVRVIKSGCTIEIQDSSGGQLNYFFWIVV